MRRVVVTGIGLITPIGIGKEEFWKNNKEGKSGICDMPELEKFGFESKAYGYVKNFKPEQLGLTLREIRRMDRITQFGVLCTDQAVKDSKIDLSKIDKNRVGVNIANAVAGTKFMDEEFSVLTNNGKEVVNPEDISPYAYARSMPNTTSNEVSYRYGFNGTCCTMATGCTTGIDSIGFAYDQIRCGELDVMICGAAEAPITPIETNVLKEIWGKEIGTVFLSCPKSMFGNTFGAAGALDAIINCLAIKNNTVPPTINYEDQDSNCDLNYTPNKALHRNINTVLQIARGRGGINSAMLLREFKE